MPTYEYAVMDWNQELGAYAMEAKINGMSVSGWRLVAVVGDRHYFERQR